ncbi:ribonuclease P protein component [Actinotignum urinale]|uniref:Ribonuclease P protein component n=2 Tax=Actinotignum urinale TaxID=190146 RepID=A0AAW9HYC1_9ACTO|nr:ribonuclease P protein component [Actinotignum urinale]MDY5133216.1 ribonuclease P protein component [Actinotignum urinale]MDY5151186.1 ribonuclease P protein component [Actinotignum urinale]MDY5155455.1 ribonuclease P protein component [Actinotignum urinale]MDY5160518.1 ribonuclease P protein component [Actinotignum urinale]WIK59599.1 ribonuclease P protein component [Actinotignum urinale]
MLPADHRMWRSAEFAQAFRGTRGSSRSFQVSIAEATDTQATDPHPVRVGFVVSKKIGNSVVRHRVTRQLRHIIRSHLDLFNRGELVVVRAFPPAKDASYDCLEKDVLTALGQARKRMKIVARGEK